MVIDTSALAAILFDEPGADWLLDQVLDDDDPVMSAATAVETGIVVGARKGPEGSLALAALLREAQVVTLPLEGGDVEVAMDGWRRFGKGNHAARLNLGDCFTYSLAKRLRVPVLCTGDDFSRTDADVVSPSD